MTREIPILMKIQPDSASPFDIDWCTVILILAVGAIVFFVAKKYGKAVRAVPKMVTSRLNKIGKKVKADIEDQLESFTAQPAPFLGGTDKEVSLQPATPSLEKTGLELCSPDCCCDAQWPVPIDLTNQGGATASVDSSTLIDYEKTSISCRSCNGTGCLCVKKGEASPVPTCTRSASVM